MNIFLSLIALGGITLGTLGFIALCLYTFPFKGKDRCPVPNFEWVRPGKRNTRTWEENDERRECQGLHKRNNVVTGFCTKFAIPNSIYCAEHTSNIASTKYYPDNADEGSAFDQARRRDLEKLDTIV